MSITITDAGLLAQLVAAGPGRVELCDPTGKVVLAAHVWDPDLGQLPPGVKSPFTAEELAERRLQTGGRPLADILRDLEARA